MRLTQLAFLGLSLVACRGGGDDDGDDTPNPDGPIGGSVTIQEVQNESMAPGTAVTLEGVVVTAIDSFGARTGDMWVQEPGGGEFSGIKVFGAPLDQIASLVPGDVVTISNAEKDEFALTEDTSGRTVTELKGAGGGTMNVVKTGTGSLPAPSMVDAKAIAALADFTARDAEWEKWEGVRINVINARQLSAVVTFGAGAADQKAFDATGGVTVETVMADFPAESVAGMCYAGIVGIGDYFFDYLLLPTSTNDLSVDGTGCTPQTTTTVSAVQMGTTTGDIILEDVFITGRDRLGTGGKARGLWVSDTLAGGQFTGVYVFTGSEPDATLVIGAKVDVIGSVIEFDVGNPQAGDKLTEISNASVTLVSAPAGLPTPAASTAAVVSDITNGEPFEGVLVSLTNVKVTNINAGAGKVELTDNNAGTVIMDNDSFDFAAQTANTCYGTLVGVMSIQLTDNVRTLNPRALTDMVVGAGCN